MPDKKKKIITAHYNELERYVIDMPFEEAVATLDASEKDMSQLRSMIVEEDDEAKLIRLTYAEASALLILVKTWARGSMAQVTVFRGETTYYIPKIISNYQGDPKTSWFTIVFNLFIMSTCGTFIFSWYLAIVALLLLGILIIMSMEIRWHNIRDEKATTLWQAIRPLPNKANSNPDITRIYDKPIPTNDIYENILLDYVHKKLKVEINNSTYNENPDIYRQLKRRNR